MITRTLARKLARGNGKTVEEEESILQQRQRDINLHGYGYAFRNEKKLRGKNDEYQTCKRICK